MSVLNSIIEGVLEDQKSRQLPPSELEERIASVGSVRDSLKSLQANSFSVIAEVKRSSPSKGSLAEISNPSHLAALYEKGGASIISVLTERRRFNGSLQDFVDVRSRVAIPMLRKDFIVNEYLVKETRAFGADLMLLIVAALDDVQLRDFYMLAYELGMRVLVEVHDRDELERALAINPEIIGVNARNLKTLDIDLDNFRALIPSIPSHIYRIAESGISSLDDVKLAKSVGANAILVGETLVKSEDPTSTIADFLSVEKS
jgi:indole-3-glycerol phosphate synthase